MLPAADTCYQLFPSDNISKGIIIKHAFCLFCWPKLHAARKKRGKTKTYAKEQARAEKVKHFGGLLCII